MVFGKSQCLSIDLLVNPDSSSENIKKPLFISLVRGAKMLDVTFCGFGRKIFAVADWARALFAVVDAAVIDVVVSVVSTFGEIIGLEKIAAVTDRGGRRLTISQLLTLMVFIGLMVTCSPAGSFLFNISTTTFATLLFDFKSNFFGFKSLIPRIMFSLLITLLSSFSHFFTAVSTRFDSSCCASSWAHDKISCSFSIPLKIHKTMLILDFVVSKIF